ncbi:MAG TPA: L,D-transpeptidase family protein, partial [Mycobacteriales bacterium]|nr:L,D-transpeptidase family protein [Mycobacteriales bacterium]
SDAATHRASPTPPTTATGTPPATPDRPSSKPTPKPTRKSTHPAARKPAPKPAPPRTTARPSRSTPRPPVKPAGLPLDQPTGSATQVITAVAPTATADTATVQAWTRQGSTWQPATGPITAHVGTDGLTTQPTESRSATPIGSFTLTQAFGAAGNPGTALPYLQTTPSDWWISQPGPLYNTHQRCASDCAFIQGDPNEHLFYETPSYNYGVVIDYNTANAGPIVPGAGSAFFLHVYAGIPSAGCVAIPQENLVSILRWLNPAAHPRILIGVGGQ